MTAEELFDLQADIIYQTSTFPCYRRRLERSLRRGATADKHTYLDRLLIFMTATLTLLAVNGLFYGQTQTAAGTVGKGLISSAIGTPVLWMAVILLGSTTGRSQPCLKNKGSKVKPLDAAHGGRSGKALWALAAPLVRRYVAEHRPIPSPSCWQQSLRPDIKGVARVVVTVWCLGVTFFILLTGLTIDRLAEEAAEAEGTEVGGAHTHRRTHTPT